MTLAEKLRLLREEEGRARGLGRALSKADVARLMQSELEAGVSAAYLSQLESGARVHLTARTRVLLANFYKVHPGYLVDDGEPGQPPMEGERGSADALVEWLRAHAQHFQGDQLVAKVLTELSARAEPRRYFQALERLLALPAAELERLIEADFCVDTDPT
ncbi:MAG: helix-turn-helix domain-containing protein [Chloroflexota bacterium]|nr:helix-turn-helix domain-containing protein [Chloroflexota bacterium]